MEHCYAICSEPGLNYEGKVFTSWTELDAYKTGKTPPMGRDPWYARFYYRDEANRFAEFSLPDEDTPPSPKRKRDDEDVIFISEPRPVIKRPKLEANNSGSTAGSATSSSTSPPKVPCPHCLGKCF